MKIPYKKIFLFLIYSVALEAIFIFINSDFLVVFLKQRIIEILLTLLAINTATSAFIVSKLQEIGSQYKHSFKGTYNEIKLSLIEQIVLIAVSASILISLDSVLLKPLIGEKLNYVFDVILIFCFIYAIEILRDTGTAMFDILIQIEDEKKED